MVTLSSTPVRLDRGYVRVTGPDAAEFLERMVSNEIASLAPGDAQRALLLTPKSRIVAPLRVVREESEAFLLITEAELGEAVAAALLRARFAAKCEIAAAPLHGVLHFSDPGRGIPNDDYGVEAWETWDEDAQDGADAEQLEALRIDARTPRWGRELDESILPAEAGLDETHVSFTKGCYPGQEPIARLHYRGKANRRLRILGLEEDHVPSPEAELELDGKVVGRITSSVPGRALGYVRTEVADDAELVVEGRRAWLH